MRIVDMAFVGYPVTDLARARKFYEETLGLQVTEKWESEDSAWIEYDIGNTTLGIGKGMEGWNPSSDGGAAALEVDDFDDAIMRLREAGVRFSHEPMETPGCQMAVIQDPDGNSLVIHKRRY